MSVCVPVVFFFKLQQNFKGKQADGEGEGLGYVPGAGYSQLRVGDSRSPGLGHSLSTRSA